MSKGNYNFLNIKYFDTAIKDIFSKPLDNFAKIIDAYNAINVMHPFREGNGRAGRIWLNVALERTIVKVIDFSLIEKDKYMEIMISGNNYDSSVMINEFQKALIPIDKENYIKVFMKNLVRSYEYEGYEFNAKDVNYEDGIER
jgi:cell filamentation protein